MKNTLIGISSYLLLVGCVQSEQMNIDARKVDKVNILDSSSFSIYVDDNGCEYLNMNQLGVVRRISSDGITQRGCKNAKRQ